MTNRATAQCAIIDDLGLNAILCLQRQTEGFNIRFMTRTSDQTVRKKYDADISALLYIAHTPPAHFNSLHRHPYHKPYRVQSTIARHSLVTSGSVVRRIAGL